MDRLHAHWHVSPSGIGVGGPGAGTVNNLATQQADDNNNVYGPVTDGTNGTPRTGKTTDPRTAGQYAYTWGAVYIP